jgi:hypothetical protein
MKLHLYRKEFTDQSTIGELWIERSFFCYTLEDAVRDIKIAGETAIPAGSYQVIMSYSPRFKTVLPLLCGVPDFEGVRIHAGNTAKHTEGCILVGHTKAENFIGQSKKAFSDLMQILKAANNVIKITIINEGEKS